MLLNILEIYTMLVFRSVDRAILCRYVPKQSTIDMYSWKPLNMGNPLNQYRHGLDAHVNESAHHRRWRFFKRTPFKSKYFKGLVVRQPDTAKGDKLRVEVVCGKCRDPRTAFLDIRPR